MTLDSETLAASLRMMLTNKGFCIVDSHEGRLDPSQGLAITAYKGEPARAVIDLCYDLSEITQRVKASLVEHLQAAGYAVEYESEFAAVFVRELTEETGPVAVEDLTHELAELLRSRGLPVDAPHEGLRVIVAAVPENPQVAKLLVTGKGLARRERLKSGLVGLLQAKGYSIGWSTPYSMLVTRRVEEPTPEPEPQHDHDDEVAEAVARIAFYLDIPNDDPCGHVAHKPVIDIGTGGHYLLAISEQDLRVVLQAIRNRKAPERDGKASERDREATDDV